MQIVEDKEEFLYLIISSIESVQGFIFKYEFQVEIKKFLDIVVWFLYLEKEVFIWELIFNVSDVLEKLCYKLVFDG